VVYLARYTHQQRSEIRAMTMDTFKTWIRVTSQLVRDEQGEG